MIFTQEQEEIVKALESTWSIPPGMAVLCLDCGCFFRRNRSTCPRCSSLTQPFDVSALVEGKVTIGSAASIPQAAVIRRQIRRKPVPTCNVRRGGKHVLTIAGSVTVFVRQLGAPDDLVSIEVKS